MLLPKLVFWGTAISMSEINLIGIHAKLRRAQAQIQQITNEAHELCNDIRQGIVREISDGVDEQVWVYQGPTPTVPVEWSVIIGETLYNMRSALDHLIWQLVLANGHTPGRHNQFPISKDCQHWQQEKDRLLKGVSRRHQAMILAIYSHLLEEPVFHLVFESQSSRRPQ